MTPLEPGSAANWLALIATWITAAVTLVAFATRLSERQAQHEQKLREMRSLIDEHATLAVTLARFEERQEAMSRVLARIETRLEKLEA